MNGSQPKISVVMPVYNGQCYLCEAVDSILNQTFSDFEFIIIDDGSTDGTWNILEKYSKQDQRIQIYRNATNLGITKTLNRGLHIARGDYIARQDSDDISMPDRFQKQVDILDNQPQTILVSCNMELIDPEGKIIGHIRRACDLVMVRWYLLFYNHISGHSQVLFRRKQALECGGYLGSRSHNEDYEMWSQLINRGEIVILHDSLLKYRKHLESISIQNQTRQRLSSVTQSKINIEKVVDRELTLEEATALRAFFEPGSQYIPCLEELGPSFFHSRLSEIYHAFRMKNESRYGFHDCLQIRSEIQNRFSLWAKRLSWHKNFSLKLMVVFYAFAWCHLKSYFSLIKTIFFS